MGGFEPITFTILFFLLLFNALRSGEKTSHRDEDIDDYWSDG
jgi:hypothetical protein|tara:strand:+ start:1152 stop:1277 length:126 start_codon:yes stop_codon:yes gene_type:complete